MRRPNPGGYPIPDPYRSSRELDRALCLDLHDMDPIELRAERVWLLFAVGARLHGEPDARLAFPGVPACAVRFSDWARARIGRIDGFLAPCPPRAGVAPVLLDPEEACHAS